MNHSEWAATRHSYRLAEKYQHPGEKLPIPSWLPLLISDRISASCQICQEFLEIKYGSAECTVCPLADFVNRLNVGAIHESPKRSNP